jgi:hypothetical protein
MQPLQLDHGSGLRQSLLQREDPRSLNRRREAREQTIWLVGLCVFYMGYTAHLSGSILGDTADSGTQKSRYNTITLKNAVQYAAPERSTRLLYLIYGVTQTFGLLLMTGADVDANICIGKHRCILVAIILFWIANVSYWALLDNPSFWLNALPYIYLIVRFRPVLDMKDGFSRFSQLMTLTLMSVLISQMPDNFFDAFNLSPKWPNMFVGIYVFAGGCCVGLVHEQARWRGESLTIQLNMGIYCYLFFQGELGVLHCAVLCCAALCVLRILP